MAELMGRADGLCGGLGGPMHLVDAEHGLLGATGVVGGNIPLALGSALAARLRGGDQVAVVFFGDGAVQAGHFNETVNLAALWGLPLIMVCENNGFAEFTPRSAHTMVERVSDVVAPYGLERETVDGNDAVAVHETFARFLAAARKGRGPLLLECLTHRLRGHYEGDPAHYREALAAEDWQEKDPILRFQRHGLEAGWWDEKALEKVASRPATRSRPRSSSARERRAAGARPDLVTRRPPPRAGVPAPRGDAPQHLPEGDHRHARRGDARRRARVRDRRGRGRGRPLHRHRGAGGRVRHRARDQHADLRGGHLRRGGRRGPVGAAARARDHVHRLHHARARPAREQAAKAHAMSAGSSACRSWCARRAARAARRRRSTRSASRVARARAGAQGRDAEPGGGRAGPAARARSRTPTRWSSSRTSPSTSSARRCPMRRCRCRSGGAREAREGGDVTIVALSRMVGESLAAAERLAAEGVEAEVIDPRTLVPLDLDDDRGVRAAHEPAGGRARGGGARRLRRRDRGGGTGRGLRLPGRADRARGRAVRARAVQPLARGRLPARQPTTCTPPR